MPINHSLTMTTPDGPGYENKPSDWNKSHVVCWLGLRSQEPFANSPTVTFGLNGGF